MNGRTSNGTTIIMATYPSTSGSAAAAATVSAGCAGDDHDHEHERENDRFVYCMYKESNSFSLVFLHNFNRFFLSPLFLLVFFSPT